VSRGAALATLAAAIAACGPGPVSLPRPARPLVATPDEPFRRAPPGPGRGRPLEAPEVVVDRLDNGLTLILLRRPGAAVAGVRYVTRRGGEAGPQELAGRAWLVGRIVERSAADVRVGDPPALEAAGLFARAVVDWDHASLALSVPTAILPETIELAARTVRHPNFEDARVEDALRAALDNGRAIVRAPEQVAPLRARGMLYGYDHRAALPLWGAARTVRGVTRAELMAFHHISWGPGESALVVVGDLEPDRLRDLAAEAFGGWTTRPPRRPDEDPWIALDSSQVARALGLESESPRCRVVLVERAPSRLSPDSIPFELLATVLGGMYSSRLNETLRRSQGLRASVQASYDARLAGGELTLVADVEPRLLASLLGDLMRELERLVDEGPTPAEIDAAAALVRERARADLEQGDAAAALIAESFALGLDLSDLARLDREIDRADPTLLRDVAGRWLRPDRAPLVVTGRPSRISMAFGLADVGQAVMQR
jgi:zinc protease